MDIDRYIAEGRPRWDRLDALAATAQRHPRRLTPVELDELLRLYRRTSADLSLVRTRLPEPALVARLSSSVARARAALESRPTIGVHTFTTFFSRRFPGAVWRLRAFVAAAALLTLGPALLVGLWIDRSPAALEATAPAAVRSAYVEEDFEAYYSDRPAAEFSTDVLVNNIVVSFVAFAGGILVGAGTVFVLVGNGMNLGFAAGLFGAADEMARFWGLILPHGLLELTAVMIAGGAGLRLGWSILVPGDRSRSRAIVATGEDCLTVLLGLIPAFVAAGVIEGFVTGSTLTTAMRVGLGVSVQLVFLSYLYVCGRRCEGDERVPPAVTWPGTP